MTHRISRLLAVTAAATIRAFRRPRLSAAGLGAATLCGFVATALAATYRDGQVVMGTVFEITVIANDDATARRVGARALAEARRWDDVLTTWRRDGELDRFNRRAGAGFVPISGELASGLVAMLSLWRDTGGAFDPAVAPLVEHYLKETKPPPGAAHRKGLGEVLAVDGGRARLAAGAALNAGAIGKGIALQHIAALLRGTGAAALVNFGGSSHLAVGHPPGESRGWRVAVPAAAGDEIRGVVWLKDDVLTTSKSGGAGFEGGAIVDPRSGTPVPAGRMATVVGAGDGWSTAMVVLGCDGLDVARRHQLEVRIEESDGRVCATPSFPLQVPTR